MIRCLVVDDEPLALHIVEDYISKIPFLQLVKSTTSAIEALTLVQDGGIDLVFLDVQMPELTGIQFLRISNGKAKVILTTAYPQYALQGYELDAMDYLLKPFSLSRFLKACNKAEELYSLRKKPATAAAAESIFIKDGYEQIKVAIDDISYVEAAGNYTVIHLAGNPSLSTRMPISDMLSLLPAQRFVRTHRAYIVAKKAVTKFDRSQVWIGSQIIPIGPTYIQCIQEL